MSERSAPALKPLKWYRNLATKKGRLENGAFLVEGERAIDQIIQNNPGEVLEVLNTDGSPSHFPQYPHRKLTRSQLDSISATKTPQGTIAVVRLPLSTYSGELPHHPGERILLLEDVQDPGNVGTLIRTAVAFGFSGIIMTEDCADLFSPKCVQSSAGTVLTPWTRRTTRYPDLMKQLEQSGYVIIAADIDGDAPPTVLQRHDRQLLALGNEASGLSAELRAAAHHRVSIPMAREKAESLNVAACGAVCMYLSYCGEHTER